MIQYLDLADPRWSTFVQTCSDALPFHSPPWASLLATCYGYRPFVLALVDGAGEIRAGLPVLQVNGPLAGRRWLSLPFTDFCPALARDGAAQDLTQALIDEALARRITKFEVHAGLPAARHVYAREIGVRHTLALARDPATLFHRFSKMHQGNIRKAERLGVQIRLGHSAYDVDIFYRLHLATRRRLGVPIQPHRFFRLLAQCFLSRGMGFVLSAHVNRMPVAAGLFLTWRGVAIYKYAASDPRFWSYRPNNLLTWAAIQWACEHGCHILDWGRSDIENTGLRSFKDGWGAREEPLIYSTVAGEPPRSPSHRAVALAGAVICHSPAWVCRAIGETLYRYAA